MGERMANLTGWRGKMNEWEKKDEKEAQMISN